MDYKVIQLQDKINSENPINIYPKTHINCVDGFKEKIQEAINDFPGLSEAIGDWYSDRQTLSIAKNEYSYRIFSISSANLALIPANFGKSIYNITDWEGNILFPTQLDVKSQYKTFHYECMHSDEIVFIRIDLEYSSQGTIMSGTIALYGTQFDVTVPE